MAKGTLTIVEGDATKPEGLGITPIIIPHVCNDCPGGVWGGGFTGALTRAFGNIIEDAYYVWAKNKNWNKALSFVNSLPSPYLSDVYVIGDEYMLGSTQFVKVSDKLVVANMIGQHNVRGYDKTGRPPIRYGALSRCMIAVRDIALSSNSEIHTCKFGSDLAGGNWETIQQLIMEIWVDEGLNVTIYDFPQPKRKITIEDNQFD